MHALVNIATVIMGESSVGPHLSVLTDLLDSLPEEELSVVVEQKQPCVLLAL